MNRNNRYTVNPLYNEVQTTNLETGTVTGSGGTTIIYQGGGLTDSLKLKLDGILEGAEVNQKAFSSVKINSTIPKSIQAVQKTDVLNISGTTPVLIDLSSDNIITFSLDQEELDTIITDRVNSLSFWKKDELGNIYTEDNAYSMKELSAYGMGSGGSTGGAGALYECSDVLRDGDRVQGAISGSLLSYNGSHWRAIPQTDITPDLSGYIKTSQIGILGGIAPLDENRLIPSTYLPSYVDDVIEVSTFGNLPVVGESGKIYVVSSTNLTYRWSGSSYVEISKSIALGYTNSTAFPGDQGLANTNSIADLKNQAIALSDMFEWDKTDPNNWVIKAKRDLYGVGEISAYGYRSGEIPTGAMYMYELKDVLFNNLTSGLLLKFNGARWVNVNANEVGLNESQLSVYLTANNYAKKSDIPSLTGYATESWVTDKGYLTANNVDKTNWNTAFGWGNHASAGYVSNTTRINAGTGLAGGGTLSANVELSLGTVGDSGTYTKVTTDAFGRVISGGVTSVADVVGLLTTLDKKLNIAEFDKWFTIEYNTNGTIKSIKALYDFYSVGEVSAYGKGDGLIPIGAMYLYELKDVFIANLTSGQLLKYNGTKWVNVNADEVGLNESLLAQYLIANGYATLSWVTSRGYLTEHLSLVGYAKESWVTAKGYWVDNATSRTNWDAAYTQRHTHANKGTLDAITDTLVSNWNTASTNSHTHGNKAVIDGITSVLISNWNTAYSWGNHGSAGYALGSTTITAGTGLTGGGSLASNRTLSLSTAGTAGTYTKITTDVYGRVISSATLIESDIPALSISKTTGLQSALDSKVNNTTFNDLFEKVNIGTASAPIWAVKVKYNLFSIGEVSAYGAGSGSGGEAGLIKTVYGSGSLGGAFSNATLTDTFNAYTINKIHTDFINHTHTFTSLTGKPTTLSGYGITDGVLNTDIRLTNSRPASDVYPWAKAVDKPSYSYGEITGTPPTADLSNYVALYTDQTITGAKSFSESLVFDSKYYTGGYARGIVFKGTADYRVGIGGHGTGGDWDRAYIGVGNSPWVTNGIRVYGSHVDTDLPIYAPSFIKSGGASTQFLKADGSVDGNSYARLYHIHSDLETSDLRNHNPNQFSNKRFTPFFLDSVKLGLYSGGFLDALYLNTYPDGSGGHTNLIALSKDTGEMYRMLVYQGSGSWNGNLVKMIDSSNWQSIVDGRYLPLTGGMLSGDLYLGTESVDKTLVARVVKAHSGELKLNPWGGNVSINDYTVWHAGNDGTGSGLDADLLGGIPGVEYKNDWKSSISIGSWSRLCLAKPIGLGGSFILTLQYTRNYVVVDNTFLIQFGHSSSGQIITLGTHNYTQIQLRLISNNGNDVYVELLDEGLGSGLQQATCSATKISCILTHYTAHTPTVSGTQLAITQTAYNKLKVNNETVAFLTDNVASATKLQTTRTIWGQNFDGSGNVDGCLVLNHNKGYDSYNEGIRINNVFSNPLIHFNGTGSYGTGDGQWTIGVHQGDKSFQLTHNSWSNSVISALKTGNVGVGIGNPIYKLHVAGDTYSSGIGYFGSRIIVDRDRFSSGSSPAISLAIGDSDTGFDWINDGAVGIKADGQDIAYWNSNEFTVNKNFISGGVITGNSGLMLNTLSANSHAHIRLVNGASRRQWGIKSGFWRVNQDDFTITDDTATDHPAFRISSSNQYCYVNSIVSNWFRSSGDSGWFSQEFGGGIHMKDSTYVRVYNDKSFWCDGDIVSAKEITAFSDERLKSNIQDLSNRGRLSAKTFFKDDKLLIGFIALDVQRLYPELISVGIDENQYLSLNYGAITAVLSVLINEVEDEVTILKEKVKQLENKIEQYESK